MTGISWLLTSSQRFLTLAIHCCIIGSALGWQNRAITWPFLIVDWTLTSSAISSSWKACRNGEKMTTHRLKPRLKPSKVFESGFPWALNNSNSFVKSPEGWSRQHLIVAFRNEFSSNGQKSCLRGRSFTFLCGDFRYDFIAIRVTRMWCQHTGCLERSRGTLTCSHRIRFALTATKSYLHTYVLTYLQIALP